MCKWVANTFLILAYLVNSAPGSVMKSGLHKFLYIFKDIVPPSDTCLYVHRSWSLAQAQQQSLLGISMSSTSVRGDRVM